MVMNTKFMSFVQTSPLNSGLYAAAYLTFALGYTQQTFFFGDSTMTEQKFLLFLF